MLPKELEQKLVALARSLIDQETAEVAVAPLANRAGFWFGGGNVIRHQDRLWLAGRYRNAGDSRTGLAAGERGLELAIWSSPDGTNWEKALALSKSDLSTDERPVLSIEGSALRVRHDGRLELFVSSEKDNIGYPERVSSYLKPGTGVWTIEHLVADDATGFRQAASELLIESTCPATVHCKDPNVCELDNGNALLTFCTHPFNWSSSNTAFAVWNDRDNVLAAPQFDGLPRGTTWDVAMTRVTCVVGVPQVGQFKGHNVKLLFYDGGECLRNLDEHAQAVTRPRGYSCEELGGLAYMVDDDLGSLKRLSDIEPFFVSPEGTGCSRYVSVTQTSDSLLATWQQSQADHSQPLVANKLRIEECERLLS